MADQHEPTWPLGDVDDVQALAAHAEMLLRGGGALGAYVAQLRQDRDELLEALELFLPYWRMELENEGPGQVTLLLQEVERAEALVARVKAGKP